VIPFEQPKDVTLVSSISSSKRITDAEMIPFGATVDPLREEFEL